MTGSIGFFLKQWRKKRRYSQLQMSLELGVSSKHISFIETGRSTPSREMIVKLGEFLILPKCEINKGLYLAGYAPVYTDLPLDHEKLKPVFFAIEKLIKNHMPYPAIVFNQAWDVVDTNDSAKEIMAELNYACHNNLIEAIILDNPLTSGIVNWHETVIDILTRVRFDISMTGGSSRLVELEKRLSLCLTEDEYIRNPDHLKALQSMTVRIGNSDLSYFSIISELSTIQDVTVNEYRVDLMFPADDVTKAFYV